MEDHVKELNESKENKEKDCQKSGQVVPACPQRQDQLAEPENAIKKGAQLMQVMELL